MRSSKSSQEKQMQAEFTLAYNSYAPALVRHSYFRLHDMKLSEDLVQEAFLKTWKRIMLGQEILMMKAFLYHVVNNLIIDQYRKHKAVSLDTLLEKGYQEPEIDETKRMQDAIDGGEALKLVDKLPSKYQHAIRMCYVDGLSLEEMSSRTGYSKNTLSVQVHRALPKLRRLANREA